MDVDEFVEVSREVFTNDFFVVGVNELEKDKRKGYYRAKKDQTSPLVYPQILLFTHNYTFIHF